MAQQKVVPAILFVEDDPEDKILFHIEIGGSAFEPCTHYFDGIDPLRTYLQSLNLSLLRKSKRISRVVLLNPFLSGVDFKTVISELKEVLDPIHIPVIPMVCSLEEARLLQSYYSYPLDCLIKPVELADLANLTGKS